MKFLRAIAIPIMPFYYLVTGFRNCLYDWGLKKSTFFNFPVICVGNLSVGGTGKTPMIEYLIRLLKDDYKIATLSRGYKRKTKGFLLANDHVSAEELGDEPFQFYNKFKGNIHVAVDGNRIHGINQLMVLNPRPEVFLLDDAYQHRRVKAGLNILLTSYDNLYVNDYVLPVGNLRESRRGANRADIIVVTKCPKHLDKDKKISVMEQINLKDNQRLFFSYIKYAQQAQSSSSYIKLEGLKPFTLVTGIANAHPLVKHLKEMGLDFEHLNFKDHYEFSSQDVKRFEALSSPIITTEKDYMRLKKYSTIADKLYYLPIEIGIDKTEVFNRMVLDYIKNN
ncbi:tetraacyldisaccharide 4'-kinase [Aestuariivivens sediminis]|uniref:tetraacyldisaccharide 4'-kinase n=1 Tax=Aestuariivivens sediminis TaxID=2913557 RepID=UPI001F596E39|nr:tetraacyldisaccharide 4'-kinase [Aestuariivivens sediminis]